MRHPERITVSKRVVTEDQGYGQKSRVESQAGHPESNSVEESVMSLEGGTILDYVSNQPVR